MALNHLWAFRVTSFYLGCCSSGGKGVPLLGQVHYESGEAEVRQGEGQVGLKWFVSLGLPARPWHPPSSMGCGACSLPRAHPFQEELYGWVPCEWQTPDQLWTMTEGRREWPLSLHLLCQIDWRPCLVNIHCFVNRLRPGRKFWKFWVKTSIYPTAVNCLVYYHPYQYASARQVLQVFWEALKCGA